MEESGCRQRLIAYSCARRCACLLFVSGFWMASVSGQTAVMQDQNAVAIVLADAIRRAEQSEPGYAAIAGERRVAQLDRSIARAALLPGAVDHNQLLYTQPNGLRNQAGQLGSQAAPRFIANNAVHEYASQGIVTETVGVLQVAEVRRADAAAARTEAEAEIARRGLVATVVSLYYGVGSSERKQKVAERAHAEAEAFVSLTEKREAGREVAHADVVKAQLLERQRERDVEDASLAAERARLELGVLLFADPRTTYTLAEDTSLPALPAVREIESRAALNNAELKSALATLRESDADVLAARGAYLPDVVVNFDYGIDAPQFATYGPDRARNLGYSAAVTVDLPVWDWLATEHRVKQSEVRREAVRVALSAAQRRSLAALEQDYREAQVAHDQVASLDLSAAAAEESLRLTKLRYSAGEATVLEVVDAQLTLTLAEDAREDGALRYRVALATLQTLTGEL